MKVKERNVNLKRKKKKKEKCNVSNKERKKIIKNSIKHQNQFIFLYR